MPALWTFGDSFTFGDGCRSDKGIIEGNLEYYDEYCDSKFDIWPNLLGKQIGYEVKNLSKSGASNDYILDSIISSFNLFQPNDTVIVSKTFFERFDIPLDSKFKTIYAESLCSMQFSLKTERFVKNQIEKETTLNYGLLYASDPLVKERQDNRFNFIKNIVSSKVDKFYIWDVDSDFRKIFNNISQHSKGKYSDYHFSFLGHIEFANALYKLLFFKKSLL